MKFIYQGTNQGKRQLATNGLFADLVVFLQEHPGAILRELKQTFPQGELLSVIELAVDQQLILRENRRYQVNFPVYNETDLVKITEETQYLQKKNEFLALEKNKQLLMAYLMMKEQYAVDFIGVPSDFPEVSLAEAGNDSLLFANIALKGTESLSLAQYFGKSGEGRSSSFEQLTKLLGDVNPEYYFDQVELILERVKNEKKVRKSIFLESLVMTGVLDESGEILRLKVPEIKNDSIESLSLPVLLIESRLILDEINNENVDDFIIINNGIK